MMNSSRGSKNQRFVMQGYNADVMQWLQLAEQHCDSSLIKEHAKLALATAPSPVHDELGRWVAMSVMAERPGRIEA
jgi:hypothetical protein